MRVFEKIREARNSMGMTQAEFAENVGIKQNEVSKLEAGGKKFVPMPIIAFLHDNNYDINTLFDDNVELSKMSIGIVQNQVEPNEIHLGRFDKRQKNQLIPLYSLEATAGLVELFEHYNEKTPLDYLTIPNLPKCDGAVFVAGDSMYPLLKSGDIVIYKMLKNIDEGIFWGEMYLVSINVDNDEFVTVKFIQKSEKGDDYIKLVSQNTNHQPRNVRKDRIRALGIIKASVRINSMS